MDNNIRLPIICCYMLCNLASGTEMAESGCSYLIKVTTPALILKHKDSLDEKYLNASILGRTNQITYVLVFAYVIRLFYPTLKYRKVAIVNSCFDVIGFKTFGYGARGGNFSLDSHWIPGES